MFLIFSLNSWNSPSTSSSSRLKFSMLNISINKYIIILLWILLGFNSNIKFIKGENDLSANIKNRKYFDFVSTKANLKKGKINFHCRYIPQQGRIRGPGGTAPPPGNLEMKGENRTILLLFIVNKKPCVTDFLNITK